MKTRQFNFARNWKKIQPYLDEAILTVPLELGMKALNPDRKSGAPPWLEVRGPLNGQRARFRKLSYYQPWGRCHHIAPFAWAIGRTLFPDLRWGFLTSDLHTVAVGVIETARDDDIGYERYELRIVMDILNFKEMTAKESVAFVMKAANWKLCFRIDEMLFREEPTPEVRACFDKFHDAFDGKECKHDFT